jgi:hypothetical protein
MFWLKLLQLMLERKEPLQPKVPKMQKKGFKKLKK